MKLCGIDFDNVDLYSTARWNYREWNESTRTKMRELWLDSYIPDHGAICRDSHNLTSRNGSAFFLDGKRLKGNDEEIAKKILKELDEVMK